MLDLARAEYVIENGSETAQSQRRADSSFMLNLLRSDGDAHRCGGEHPDDASLVTSNRHTPTVEASQAPMRSFASSLARIMASPLSGIIGPRSLGR
jgi:hypothetical protein